MGSIRRLSRTLRALLLPGLVYQSVLIGGGYATGRELAEFFLPYGPTGGVLAMLVATVVWSVVLAVSFEFSRLTRSYDYREFFRSLLGRGWFLFEIAYVCLIILILSVLGAAAGSLMNVSLGLPEVAGTVIMMASVGLLAFYGSKVIERFLTGWSVVLYIAYAVFFALWISSFGETIAENFVANPVRDGWVGGGISYAGYNLVGFVAVLFSLRHLTSRKEAVVAGLAAGPLAMIPGLLFFVAMVGFYPSIADEPVPVNAMLLALDAPILMAIFQVVLFGTFVETGIGFIHAVNERIVDVLHERHIVAPPWLRPSLAIVLLSFSVTLANMLGIVSLIASGYGTLTYVILAVFVIPLLTVGLRRILKAEGKPSPDPGRA